MKFSENLLAIVCWSIATAVMAADDGYIKAEGNCWRMGTASVERVVALEDGKLLLKSLKNKVTGRELVPSGATSPEFFLRLGEDKQLVTGATGTWKLIRADQTKLKQGELQLDLAVQRESLLVTKSYVIYPGSSVMRQWVTIKNAGDQPLVITEPGFLAETVRPGDPEKLDFHWMTGAENKPNSWMLVTETLASAKARTFDSYEPFFGPGFPCDGVMVKVELNGKQVWPAEGWLHVPPLSVTPMDFGLDVAAGDKLAFVVNMNRNSGRDMTVLNPTIKYDDGESHSASQEFGDKQGHNGWRFQYITGNGQQIDMVYNSVTKQWCRTADSWVTTPCIGPENQQPGPYQDTARVWTVSKAGHVRVIATVRNMGINPGAEEGYAFREGSSTYVPWYAMLAKDTRDGVVIGWDYIGHWVSSFQRNADGSVAVVLKVAGYKQTLEPGKSVITPKAFVGLFHNDLDEAGNEVLDWQYRYLWDYTRDGWFPAIRMLGHWYKGSCWDTPGMGWVGGNPDLESTFRKVFRIADLMRYVGGDVYHRDHGWWDRAGEWNGPDFRTTGNYLRKSNMGQLIYAFLYTVDRQSKVAKEHPDWVIGETLDMSKPEVVEFMKRQLDEFYDRWGVFEWRNDSTPTSPRNGVDDTPLLGQDAGLRKVIHDFLDKHPDCAFQAVNGGGKCAGYDYARFSSSLSFSDGNVGILCNYYASLLLPPDKTSDIPDKWDPNKYDKATWRGLLAINFDMTGDTWDPAKLEGVRELIDIYHYLHKQGVVGRWVRVYRPQIVGDDRTMYLQRMSGDRRRGIIIPKRPARGAITIKPKGLLPAETYTVTFHESDVMQQRSGANLMECGIALEKMAPGELIYLNLPLHPGNKLDKDPPTVPGDVKKQLAENMGYPGVELTWKPGSDNNWVSYYEVFRNDMPIDRVAKGAYYFDHSAGADMAAKYEVRTVDGAGNASGKAVAAGAEAKPAHIVDDTKNAAIAYSGEWQSQTALQPAHAGTLSSSKQQGATCSLTFEGKRILWFSKLGANAGKAAVSVDGSPVEIIDTYSADDIWGVCMYRKEFPTAGRHKLQITVLGQHHPRAKDSAVAIDGFRIEP